MVVKIQKSASSTSGALSYNRRKVELGEADVVILSPAAGESLDAAQEEFRRRERRNIRCTKVSFHASVNPNRGEGPDRTQVARFCRLFMEELGYAGQPYVVFRHRDIERVHYHILSTRVDALGHKIPDFQEHYRVRDIVSKLAKTFGYTPGRGEHGREDSLRYRFFVRSRGDTVAQMEGTFREACCWRFVSWPQFRQVMNDLGVEVRIDPGEDYGMVMRGLDSKGKACTAPVHEDALHLPLYRQYESRARECIASQQPLTVERRRVHALLRGALDLSSGESHLRNLLSRQGIGCSVIHGEDGAFKDIVLTDRTTRCAFSGSEVLGKELHQMMAAVMKRWSGKTGTPLPEAAAKNEKTAHPARG